MAQFQTNGSCVHVNHLVWQFWHYKKGGADLASLVGVVDPTLQGGVVGLSPTWWCGGSPPSGVGGSSTTNWRGGSGLHQLMCMMCLICSESGTISWSGILAPSVGVLDLALPPPPPSPPVRALQVPHHCALCSFRCESAERLAAHRTHAQHRAALKAAQDAGRDVDEDAAELHSDNPVNVDQLVVAGAICEGSRTGVLGALLSLLRRLSKELGTTARSTEKV